MATDRLTRLADALAEVGARVNEISAELRDLQQTTVPAMTAPPPMPPPMPLPVPPPVPVQLPTPMPMWPQLPPPEPPKPPVWERDGVGSRILAWAGGVVTLAGVVLLLVLAIQRGYLGPLPRVLLGAGLGLALLGIGLRLHRNPHARTGAYALAATGIAVLFLDVIAATTLFGFLPSAAGLAVGLVVAALGVLLAELWSAEGLAVFVLVCCALCAPVLTDGNVALLLGFLLVLQLGATPVQLARRWSWLCLAAGVPPVLATVVTTMVTERGGVDSATVAYLGLVTSVAQVAVATVSAARRLDDNAAFGLVLLAPVPALLSASLVPQLAAVVLPGTVGALLLLVWVLGYTRLLALPARFGLAAGGAGSVAVLQATVTAVDGSVAAIVLLAQALLLTLVAHLLRYRAALLAASLFGTVGFLATVVDAAPPALLALAPGGAVPVVTAATAGLTGLLLAVTAAAMVLVARRGLVAGGLVTLYGAAAAVLSVGLLISPDRTGFLLGHVLVTVSWTVGALVLLMRGIDSGPARVAGMSLVGAALVKLVLFDLSSLDGMARVAAFLVAGLVLLAAGARYARLLASRPPRNT